MKKVRLSSSLNSFVYHFRVCYLQGLLYISEVVIHKFNYLMETTKISWVLDYHSNQRGHTQLLILKANIIYHKHVYNAIGINIKQRDMQNYL